MSPTSSSRLAGNTSLRAWPTEIAADDLVTFFSPTDDDVTWLRGAHRPENQLGVVVQLCSLPWLGWVPDELADCTAAASARLAAILAIDPAAGGGLLAYGGWQGRTRRDHRVLPVVESPTEAAPACPHRAICAFRAASLASTSTSSLLVGLTASALLLNERLHGRQWLGAALVIIAVIAFNRRSPSAGQTLMT